MHSLALLTIAAVAAASPRTDRGRGTPANLLVGPARCVLRYLEAVRRAEPHPPAAAAGRPLSVNPQDYARARELTAPRTLEQIDRSSARGGDHPLAPWQEVARSRLLEAFQLVSVRRAPRGAAVVRVVECWSRPGGARLEETASEYLVARVDGEWKVVDRRPGATFDDEAIASGYVGYFDEPSRR